MDRDSFYRAKQLMEEIEVVEEQLYQLDRGCLTIWHSRGEGTAYEKFEGINHTMLKKALTKVYKDKLNALQGELAEL